MRIPRLADFGSDFLADETLKALGERVIHEKLDELDDGELIIDYAWKKKGGTNGGHSVLGKCVKLSGPARYYAGGAHFLIWLSADHCYAHGFNDRQFEALMFHELKHIEREERFDDEGNFLGVVYKTRGHDVELFLDELRIYGDWKSDLAALVRTVQQLPLPGMDREPVAATA